jgi:hypothetical protein
MPTVLSAWAACDYIFKSELLRWGQMLRKFVLVPGPLLGISQTTNGIVWVDQILIFKKTGKPRIHKYNQQRWGATGRNILYHRTNVIKIFKRDNPILLKILSCQYRYRCRVRRNASQCVYYTHFLR